MQKNFIFIFNQGTITKNWMIIRNSIAAGIFIPFMNEKTKIHGTDISIYHPFPRIRFLFYFADICPNILHSQLKSHSLLNNLLMTRLLNNSIKRKPIENSFLNRGAFGLDLRRDHRWRYQYIAWHLLWYLFTERIKPRRRIWTMRSELLGTPVGTMTRN